MSWRAQLPDLLTERAFSTQSDLVDVIRVELGEIIDQSTISRELRTLGARKIDGVYRLPPPPALGAPVHDVSITAGGCLVVVRTDPAFANVIASAIDEASIEGVLGTIAGDDTLFIATSGPSCIPSLRRLLSNRRR